MQEQWIPWKPLAGSLGKYYLNSITDQDDLLKIIFNKSLEKESKIIITFNKIMVAYSLSNESYRVKTMNELGGGGVHSAGWPFCQVLNSELLRQAMERSGDLVLAAKLKHFVMGDDEFFLDVIATEEPKFELVASPELSVVNTTENWGEVGSLREAEPFRPDWLAPFDPSCEQWVRWEPAAGLASRYELDFLLAGGDEGCEDLVLVDAEDKTKKVRLKFQYLLDVYRKGKISPTHRLYRENRCDQWAFFKVINSQYINWVEQESYGFYSRDRRQHYAIVVGDSLLEVLDYNDPLVELFAQL